MNWKRLMEKLNPLEWFKTLYAAFGVKHPIGYLIVLMILGVLAGYVVWELGAYKYRQEIQSSSHSHEVAVPPQNTTYGSQSPIMPGNSGSVVISNEPSASGTANVSKETKKNEKSSAGKNP